MPANFLKTLKKPVRLKPGEACSWARHLRWGTAARSLWRQLNKYASVREDGTCWASIKAISGQSAKFKNQKKVGRFHYDRIRHLLADFESAGLIGPRMSDIDPDGDDSFQVHGQHMHDQLCRREGNECRYLGWNYAAWLPKNKDKVADPVAGKVAEPVADQVAGRVADQKEKGSRSGSRSEMPQDLQNQNLQPSVESSSASGGAPNQGSQVITESAEAGESANSQSEKQTATAKATISLSMTDQNQNPQPCGTDQRQTRRVETIRDHFGHNVTLDKITEDEIDKDKIDKYSLRVDWDGLEECCREVVEEWGARGYLGRKTNGDVMAEAGVRWTDRNGGKKVDKFWWAVAAKFRNEGGPSKYSEFASPGFPSPLEVAARNAGLDITPYRDLIANQPREGGYRAGWKFLAQWLAEDPRELPDLAKLRDWLFENDAMPDKPATPPWE
jgi:hypothetical protein